MKQNTTIRQFISFFLLVVFAISSTPKTYFHDVFANHEDSFQTCTDKVKEAHFHQSGVNCHFDQLVVSSPYHFIIDPANEVPTHLFNRFHAGVETFYTLQPFLSTVSRGPPFLS